MEGWPEGMPWASGFVLESEPLGQKRLNAEPQSGGESSEGELSSYEARRRRILSFDKRDKSFETTEGFLK